jgi:transcriptional regulator of acetoin/glycerol metabolism
MERLALLVSDEEIRADHLSQAILGGAVAGNGGGTPAPARGELSLKQMERERIRSVLAEESWHHLRAAERLGMPVRTLYRKIKAYSIARPQ